MGIQKKAQRMLPKIIKNFFLKNSARLEKISWENKPEMLGSEESNPIRVLEAFKLKAKTGRKGEIKPSAKALKNAET